MKKGSFLFLCMILLNTLGCSLAPSNSGTGSTPAPLAGRSRGPDFVSLVKQLQPAVVNVSATTLPVPPSTRGVRPQGSFNDDRSGDFFGGPPTLPQTPRRQQGSGFIIGTDGTILTNAHVVDGAKKIIVKLADKRELEARVVGEDAATDVAILKIDVKESLPTIRLGDSDNLEVGEWVMAVGNPFGLDSSVSSGIVSGKGRNIGEAYDRLIQTDEPLNPGSSGGPLIDLNGQVVGINKAIVSATGGSIGISSRPQLFDQRDSAAA